MTEWRIIPSFSDYEASASGLVRRIHPGKRQKETKPLAITTEKNGYLRVRIWVNGRGKNIWLHRAVCEAFHGPAPTEKHQAAHDDGVRSHCSADNLAWKTRKENYQDAIRHGTSKRGEGNHMARLSADQVLTIRKRGQTEKSAVLADEFGISAGAVTAIIRRDLWSHL